MLRLLKLKYPKIHATIDVPNNTTLETENGVSATAKYSDDRKRVLVTLNAFSKSIEHPEWFDLSAQMVGVFSCEALQTEEDYNKAQAEGYDMLFPLLQSLFVDLSTKAGIPPYYFDKPVLKITNVKK